MGRFGVSDARCAEVLEKVEDALEREQPDYNPMTKWAGGSWRTGRSSLHTGRIRDRAEACLPAWVIEGARRHYEREDS